MIFFLPYAWPGVPGVVSMDSLEKRRVNVYVILGFQIFVGLLSGKQLVASLHIRILHTM